MCMSGVIAVVMPKLRPAAYSKHDKINEPTVNAREMYFILAGTVDEFRHERKEGSNTKSIAPDWMTSSRGGSAQERHARESINAFVKGPRMGEGMHFNEVCHALVLVLPTFSSSPKSSVSAS